MFCGCLVGDGEMNESGLVTVSPKLSTLLCPLDDLGAFQQDFGHTAPEPCPCGLGEAYETPEGMYLLRRTPHGFLSSNS